MSIYNRYLLGKKIKVKARIGAGRDAQRNKVCLLKVIGLDSGFYRDHMWVDASPFSHLSLKKGETFSFEGTVSTYIGEKDKQRKSLSFNLIDIDNISTRPEPTSEELFNTKYIGDKKLWISGTLESMDGIYATLRDIKGLETDLYCPVAQVRVGKVLERAEISVGDSFFCVARIGSASAVEPKTHRIVEKATIEKLRNIGQRDEVCLQKDMLFNDNPIIIDDILRQKREEEHLIRSLLEEEAEPILEDMSVSPAA